MRKLLCLLLGGALLTAACTKTPTAVSPDKNVQIALTLNEEGEPAYTVTYGGTEVIASSRLGLVLAEGDTLGKGLRIKAVKEVRIDESYPIYAGKRDSAVNRCTELTVTLEEKTGTQRYFDIILRAYDDGAALRYTVPQQTGIADYDLTAELTQFALAGTDTLWAQTVTRFYKNHYEHKYQQVTVDSLPDSSFVQLPLVFENSGYAGAISEAELKNYAGLYLQKEGPRFTAAISRTGDNPVVVRSEAGLTTPWRLVMLEKQAVDLIGSDLVTNLSSPCAIDDPSWIRPGKVSWDWWNDRKVVGRPFKSGMNNETMKYFIDFASEKGLEYMLIDAGWYGEADDTIADITKTIPQIDIPMLVEYANERNVGLMLWTNWINTRNQLEEAMKQYADWGIKGLKIDYMDGDLQRIVEFYWDVADCAARNRLLVDFHGAYKPTGLRRTYPNVMTYEGVLGLEHAKWSRNITPKHNVTLPFTRMIVGPMDYTPGAMDNRTAEAFVADYSAPSTMGTRAHQLAMYVVYESPLQMLSDHPAAYRGQVTTEFLKAVPVSWDETLPLEGAIGEYVVLARRKGDKWFVGAMTGEAPRSVTVPLAFLDKERSYTATRYGDAPDSEIAPKNTLIEKITVTAADTLTIDMVAGGGAAVIIE